MFSKNFGRSVTALLFADYRGKEQQSRRMRRSAKASVPAPAAMLATEPIHTAGTGKRQNRPGPDLEIAAGAFTDETVVGLIDDWLVPLLVESLVRERLGESREE